MAAPATASTPAMTKIFFMLLSDLEGRKNDVKADQERELEARGETGSTRTPRFRTALPITAGSEGWSTWTSGRAPFALARGACSPFGFRCWSNYVNGGHRGSVMAVP